MQVVPGKSTKVHTPSAAVMASPYSIVGGGGGGGPESRMGRVASIAASMEASVATPPSVAESSVVPESTGVFVASSPQARAKSRAVSRIERARKRMGTPSRTEE